MLISKPWSCFSGQLSKKKGFNRGIFTFIFLVSHYFMVICIISSTRESYMIFYFFFFVFKSLPLCQYFIEIDRELENNHIVSQGILMETEVSVLENVSLDGFMTD